MAVRSLAWIGLTLGVVPIIARPATAGPRTQVTIFRGPAGSPLGGTTYGGLPIVGGAMITEQRELEIPATGELRITGIAVTADPGSAQLRDLTEPTATIAEQRFVPGATTPTEIIARRIGEQVTVVTTRGDVAGTLRAIDDHSIVVEIGTGDQRRVSVMRREGYVLDVRLAGLAADKPSFAWRLAGKQRGKHTFEVTYRADGISWTPDYLAVLDEAGKTIDFNAWATVRNAAGVTFEGATLALVGPAEPAARGMPATPVRFAPSQPMRLVSGDSIQIPLVPAKVGAKVRSVIAFEAMPDPTVAYQAEVGIDCSSFNGLGTSQAKAEIALEVDLPPQIVLPEGRVRLFRRRAGRLEVVNESGLRSTAGVARIRLNPNLEIAGERKALACTVDERARTLTEKVEVKVENKGTQTSDVLVREFLWRTPVWRVESEDKKGMRAGTQTQEYRLRIPAKGTQSITYSVLYTW
jgi:hypothetical protein